MERDHAFITDKADLRNTRVGSKREICLFPRWRRKGGSAYVRMRGACPTSQGRERKPEGSWLFTKVPTGDSQVTAPRRDPSGVFRTPGVRSRATAPPGRRTKSPISSASSLCRCWPGPWRFCGRAWSDSGEFVVHPSLAGVSLTRIFSARPQNTFYCFLSPFWR